MTQNTDFDGYNLKSLRDKLVNSGDLNALSEAGLVDDDTVDYLVSFERSYEPGDREHWETGRPAARPEDTQHWRDIVRPEISKALHKAVQNGNMSVIEFANGFDDDDHDVPFQEALTLENMVHGDEFKIFVFTGGQGGGKSYFAYLLSNYKMRLCRRDGIPARAVTNSLSAVQMNEDLDFVGSPQDLLDYRLENPGHIVLVLDEASSFFDSKSGNAHNLQNFVPFLRRLRKMKILPIIVSHRAMDVGTDIRKLDSTVFIHKPDKETAVFYDDSDGDELGEQLLEISGYSTDERYDFDTDDIFISWKWDGLDEIVELMENPQEFKSLWEEKGVVKDLRETAERLEEVRALEDERDDLIRAAADLDYSQSELAEFARVDPSRVSRLLADE